MKFHQAHKKSEKGPLEKPSWLTSGSVFCSTMQSSEVTASTLSLVARLPGRMRAEIHSLDSNDLHTVSAPKSGWYSSFTLGDINTLSDCRTP